MRIAQLAPLAESVPPHQYGGTELVVNLLTEDLVKRGNEVTLFAAGDSRTEADLVAVTQSGLRADSSIPLRRWQAYDINLLLELEKRQGEFDIIHNHMGYQALPVLQKLKTPSLTTNHNLIKDYCANIYLSCKKLPYVSISNAYRQANYANDLNYIDTVYNGIDVDSYVFEPNTKRTYLLFLGRVCHDKGTLPAIEIALKLGIPLKIAGKVDEADKKYYEEKIVPYLKNPLIEYVGEVGFAEKTKLYKGAIAVVYPIAFAEPFGLVMAEALALGTPIMAFDKGSVRELIIDGQTGIIGASNEELIKRFSEIEHISPQTCREHVINSFSKERMVDKYESLYRKLCH